MPGEQFSGTVLIDSLCGTLRNLRDLCVTEARFDAESAEMISLIKDTSLKTGMISGNELFR
jgi:hypothetical protein